jgi:hypothetical protein
MDRSKVKEILMLESPNVPLEKIDFDRKQIINPITKKPYDKGMILEGIFADLTPNVNRNNRIYNVPEYLEHLQVFRKQVLSDKGIYGELEHPNGYMVNYNNISHKVLDVWYEPETMRVKGIILLLNTPKGKIAQEIVESGGLISMSARAAGTENQNPDGTVSAGIRLLVTYDIVCNSGFIGADMKYIQQLNESYQRPFTFDYTSQQACPEPSFCIIEVNKLRNVSGKRIYGSYTSLCESAGFNGNFIDYLNQQEFTQEQDGDAGQQKQQQVLQKNEPSDQNKKQEKLSKAVDKDLKQSNTVNGIKSIDALMDVSNGAVKKQMKQNTKFHRFNATVYDGAAGFISNDATTSAANYTSLSQEERRIRKEKIRKLRQSMR